MQLASIRTAPSTDVAVKAPTYIGLRVSDDREFSAPEYADKVRSLAATDAFAAVAEAQDLLKSGAFDGAGPRDAAQAVAILQGATGGFTAGVVTEATFGRYQPVSVDLLGTRFDHWFEPIVAGVATPTELHVIKR